MSREFEIFQKRLTRMGNSQSEIMVNEKLASFMSVLAKSYNAEDLEKDGVTHKGLISDERQSLGNDEKVLSIPFDAGYKVGDLAHWVATDSRWLVITHELTEKAYFKGHIKRAIYKFRWRNKLGVICETWAAIKGPTGEAEEKTAGGAVVESHDNSMTLWFGAISGYDALVRDGSIMIANKVWKINSVNDVTTPGLVEMEVVQDIPDEDQDNTTEQIARDYEYMTAIVDSAEITGPTTINPIDGLEHTYTLSNALTGGVWNINPTFASVLNGTDTSVTLKFTSAIGTTELTYSIGGNVAASKTIKVTSIFG